MDKNGFILALLVASVIASGCSNISQDNTSDVENVNLENSQLGQILGEGDISRNEIQSIPEGINSSQVSNWKKIKFTSSSSDQELNYSIYELENETLARDQIDNYSNAILKRGTHPTVGTKFNGFEVHDDQESYKVFEEYRRTGRFIFGVSIKSSEYETEQAKNLNSHLNRQISNLTESDRIYANPETLTLSLSQMPTREDSIGTNFQSGGRVHRVQVESDRNLSSDNILEIAESSFRLGADGDTSNNPALILNSVKLYETEQAAKEDQAEFIDAIRENATSYEKLEVYGNATKMKFIPSTGFRNVIILGNTENLNYYVIAAGSNDYFPDITEDLFLKLYSEVIFSQKS